MLKIFRPPIGEGSEGMLYGGAITPDAKIVAVGGWTGYEWEKTNSIYFFDAAKNTILQRINGLPNVINDIEFSQDGKYMVVCMGAKSGIRIYKIPEYANFTNIELLKSFTYGADTYNAVFDNTGRLATVSFDGKIRLYSKTFDLLKEIETTAGKEPFSIAFSPDGTLIAVGYNDSYKIEVRDGKTLALLYEPDITTANTLASRLENVCFSYDGNYLLAGCYFSKYENSKWWRQIRVWKNKGKGDYSDYPAGLNSIMDIKPMPDNSFIYASSNPEIGRIKINGTKIFYKSSETNAYNANDKTHFKVNNDASIIEVTPFGGDAMSFSVLDRTLTQTTSKTTTELESFKESHSGIKVTDWKATYYPKINSKSTSFLKTNETSFSVDIANDAKKIIFGTNWYITCVNTSGEKLWTVSSSGAAFAVNISANNKIVTAAIGDGTIRWYSMTDGTLLLSLYLNPDNKRWILWTKSGYYDCSIGAEDLIGWHINNGAAKEASYYSASKFKSVYYRPDIIVKILETLDEAKAIELCNITSNKKNTETDITKMLPPTVKILSPDEGFTTNSNTVSLKYSITSPNNKPITSVKIMVDGRTTVTNKGLVESFDSEATTNITIPSANCKISVIAGNEFGFSEEAILNIVWTGKSISQTEVADILKPNLYVLAVGVSKYDKKEYILEYAAKDAKDFSEKIALQKGGLYNNVNIKLLTDADATKDNILDGLDWIQKETTSRDVAMIYIGGHGVNDATGVFYYLPVNADVDYMKRSCLMYSDIQNTVSSIAGKVILFVDACHSGNVFGTTTKNIDVNAFVNELANAENGAIVFTSSTGKQYSQESSEWQNGAFTEALLKGISGEADYNKTGIITVKYLDAYIANKVKELTKGTQAPTTIIPKSVPDFPIIIVK